ncbi:beta-propeller fold lactonase family protein, partial [candidate division KSB1 bacterium]|nr:beta-propeller fold lactonase family protein [candidate division KSB1 bacterium]
MQTLYIGTYTSGSARGIYRAEWDNESGRLSLLGYTPCENPSYLATSPQSPHLYAVNENDGATGVNGQVSAFVISADG